MELAPPLVRRVAYESGQIALLLGVAWLGYYVARNAGPGVPGKRGSRK